MKRRIYIVALLFLFAACNNSDDKSKDTQKPIISDNGIVASPQNCQFFKRGEVIPFYYVFTDDTELGAFNIEIHNNFTHHTHSTSSEDCDHDDEQPTIAVNPWVYNQDFTIPEGSKTYTVKMDITIPQDIDAGDYHFMIRLTDKAGWQEIKSVAIEITE